MPHSWIWRRSEMDSEHWGIWELLQHGIDRYKLVAVVVVVESFVLVTTLDDLRPPFGVHIHSVMGTFSSFRAKEMKVGACVPGVGTGIKVWHPVALFHPAPET